MSLVTANTVLTMTDHLANMWNKILPHFGRRSAQTAPVAGTFQYAADALLDQITVLGDYDQQNALLQPAYTLLTKANQEVAVGILSPIIASLNDHFSAKGSSVDSTIIDLSTFLTYYNGGSGGSAYANMVVPEFGDLYYALFNTRLPDEGVMAPAIHPDWVTSASAYGMGSRAVGGSYNDGDAVNTTLYSAVQPLIEVTASFTTGTQPADISIAGTDDTGANTTTWTVTLDSNNTATAVSTTITPACTAQARQTVAVASLSGIIAGSVMKVNAGLVDYEPIIVESIDANATTITAVFQLAHSGGAALTGKRTYATTPSTGTRRCRNVSGITITTYSHSAGTVRVIGKQARAAV